MGGFANYVGACMGGEYDDSWVTNTNYPERQALLGPDGKLIHLPDLAVPTDTAGNKYTPDSKLLGEVPGLLSDHGTYEQVESELHGPGAINWESKTFVDLRKENDALKPAQVDTLSSAWHNHGNTLQTESTAFKDAMNHAINGHWTGASAHAANAASQAVTQTSIYDFTPSADALANRLQVLSGAFRSIQSRFPTDANDKLIDSGNFNQATLDDAIHQFNSEYHLDGGGRLRNNSDGYVAAQQAVDQLNQIKRSIADYQLAVQLFRDTYNPTVEAVTNDFPNLPGPPNMTFGQPAPGAAVPSPGGPVGPSASPSNGPGGGTPTGPGPVSASPHTPGTGTPTMPTPGAGDPCPCTCQGGSLTPSLSATSIGKSACTCGSRNAGRQAISTQDSQITTPTDAMQSMGASGLLSTLASTVQQALGAATGAATPTSANAANMKMPLREGELNLGKGALGGEPALDPKAAGSGGAALSAPAGGLGAPKVPGLAAAASHAVTAAEAGSATVPAAASTSSGSPGAPGAAGHGAGHGAQGKDYKASKALRNIKNGNNIVEEIEASIAVIGQEIEAEVNRLINGGRTGQ